MRILEQMRLTCTTGSHNKQYMVYLEEHEGERSTLTYIVRASYGPIGKSPKQLLKYRGHLYHTALSTYNDLVEEKQAKGYRNAPWADLIPTSPVTPIRRTSPTSTSHVTNGDTVEFYDDALRKINL